MKTILITLVTVFLSNTIYATELSWVDEQIEAIKPPRKGVKILGINNPFIFLEKNKTKKKETKKGPLASSAKKAPLKSSVISDTNTTKIKSKSFNLSTVINSSAMINGSWYKKGDKINSYTIIEVTKNTVTLQKGNKKGDKQLTLSTNVKKQNLKFKNK